MSGKTYCCASKSTDHLILVLNKELDTLNGRRRGLGDCSRHTTHHEVDCERVPGQQS